MANQQQAKPPRFRLTRSGSLVVVEVGPLRVKYHIHRPLLEYHSEYFTKALNGPWKESQDGVVKLRDIENRTFTIFVDWLYTQTLPQSRKEWMGTSNEETDDIGSMKPTLGAVQLAALKTYVLADRLKATRFSDAIERFLRILFVNIDSPPWFEPITYAFNNLPVSNPILDLLVHMQCHKYDADNDKSDEYTGNVELLLRSELPHEFLVRVMVRYSHMQKDLSGPGAWKPCDYHNHKTDEERKECKFQEVYRIGTSSATTRKAMRRRRA